MSETTKARCNSTGGLFDVGNVEVVQRYADCSVFRCPCCGGTHDDRMSWGGPRERRMGYTLVTGAPTWSGEPGWLDE